VFNPLVDNYSTPRSRSLTMFRLNSSRKVMDIKDILKYI